MHRPWLNVGCGSTAPEGWVNLDRSPGLVLARFPRARDAAIRAGVLSGPQAEVRWPPNVRRVDVTKGLPFPDRSVGVVYSSHMLEHLARDEALAFLDECRRILRPDGLVRLGLPDLRRMAEMYLASDAPDAADAFVGAVGLGRRVRPRGTARLVEAVSGARHRWMYDARSIGHLCRERGFADVRERSFREGRCPDLAAVEHREDSCFVEAALRPID